MTTVRTACKTANDTITPHTHPNRSYDLSPNDSTPNRVNRQSAQSDPFFWSDTVMCKRRVSSKKPPLPPRLAKQSVTVIDLDDDDLSPLNIGVGPKPRSPHDPDIDVVDQYVSSSSTLSSIPSMSSSWQKAQVADTDGSVVYKNDFVPVDHTCITSLQPVQMSRHAEHLDDQSCAIPDHNKHNNSMKRTKNRIRWLHPQRGSRSDAFLTNVWNWSLSVLRKCRLSVSSFNNRDDTRKLHPHHSRPESI